MGKTLLAVAALTLLLAIPAVPAPTGPSSGGTLVYGMWQEPDTFDPHVTGGTPSWMVLQNIFDRLLYKDSKGKYWPGLAASWEISPNGRIFTLRLRSDVKFHDGTTFNAEAVKFNFDRIADPETRSRFARAALGPYERSEVVDEFTVKIHMKEGMTPFLEALAGPFFSMVSPTAAKTWPREQFFGHFVGSGPFVFKEWIPKQAIRLARNPNYKWASPLFKHQGPTYLDGVEIRPLVESATRVACLEARECTMVDEIPVRESARLKQTKSKEVEIFVFSAHGIPRLWLLNLRFPPTDELAVRKAINLGINRDEISQKLYLGFFKPAYGYLANLPGQPAVVEFDELKKFDSNRAKQILQEAGWVDTDGDGIREKAGRPLRIFLYTLPDDPIVELTQAQLRGVGMDVQIKLTDRANFDIGLRTGKDWSMVLHALCLTPEPDCLYQMFHSSIAGRRANFPYLENSQVDQLLDRARKVPEGQARANLYKRAQQLIYQDLPATPVYVRTEVFGVSTRLRGITWGTWGALPHFYDAFIQK